jgi:hypothetical protein
MDSSFEFVADGGDFRNLIFFDVSLWALAEFFVDVSDHVGDFTLK